MTNLLVKTEKMSVPIDRSSLISLSKMSDQQFYAFCQTNLDLRIERNASGEVIVMPPAFSDTGNRNSRISGQLYVWAEADGTGEAFDSSAGFTLPNGATRSPDASWIKGEYIENGVQLGLLLDRKQQQVHVYRPGQEPEILDQPDAVSGEPEMPGFTLKMTKIW